MVSLAQNLYSVGCAGINIEDSKNRKSLSIETGAECISSLRAAANKLNYDLFINARIDSWLLNESRDPEYLITRSNAYLLSFYWRRLYFYSRTG
ncbi:isocitrate lyase/phosphoenolpyruvate mutase family protein [Xenorhabdus sp. M]|uniref:Isocitrate lyase/phosphoenolpyruvate mutase family protein n=1 Tax=Xenorhabdus szentirmaii TaxID=290112 RepID=A0AAW3YY67_9GAMM|nr:isocitrate lyase/phosphoenolpyruvate mutase family protein [Xenorhabdus sp. M]